MLLIVAGLISVILYTQLRVFSHMVEVINAVLTTFFLEGKDQRAYERLQTA